MEARNLWGAGSVNVKETGECADVSSLFLGLLYFLPTILAVKRGHDVIPILLLNFFFGWTGIGWLIMFVWAICSCGYPRHSYYPYRYAAPPPPPYYDANYPYRRG